AAPPEHALEGRARAVRQQLLEPALVHHDARSRVVLPRAALGDADPGAARNLELLALAAGQPQERVVGLGDEQVLAAHDSDDAGVDQPPEAGLAPVQRLAALGLQPLA